MTGGRTEGLKTTKGVEPLDNDQCLLGMRDTDDLIGEVGDLIHIIQNVLVASTQRVTALEKDIKDLKGTVENQNEELVTLKGLCGKQDTDRRRILPTIPTVVEDDDTIEEINDTFDRRNTENYKKDTVRLYRIGRIDGDAQNMEHRQILIEFKDSDKTKQSRNEK